MAGADEVALVHDYFVQDGGAEAVALRLARLLPSARVYTTFFDEQVFGGRLDSRRVRRWPLDGRLGTRRFRNLLPLYPLYFSTLDLRHARLVVSSSSAFAKAVRTGRSTLHLAYIHTPMRFAWALDDYLHGASYGAPASLAARLLRAPLAAWDRTTSRRPDLLVANSETVRRRIRECWNRDALVIYPPVRVTDFKLTSRDDGFLLVAARLLAYRRIDVAIAAAAAIGRELVIVGDGPERRRLEAMAGHEVRFTGHLARPALVDLFERCHAYLVPGVEDFGIAPVEAMACGKPVVAFERGGATETVVDGVTGVLFDRQTPPAMAEAMERLDALSLDASAIRAHAERFDASQFDRRWRSLLAREGVDERLYLSAD